MISPERLRSHPFFAGLSDNHLKSVAMLSEIVEAGAHQVIIQENQPADCLFWLLEGSVELFFRVEENSDASIREDFTSGWLDPGDMIGLSALVEPYRYVTSARTAQPSRLVKIDAQALRQLCGHDALLGYELLKRVASLTLERLKSTRVQLAAAWK